MDVGHVFPPANGAHGTHGVNGVNGSAVTTTPNEDPAMERLPDIPPMSRIWGHHRFDLAIQQQPQRARMCGFGDKDRRPITPPLIIQALIFDQITRQEIDYETKFSSSKLVLHVNLWDSGGNHEENCVKTGVSTTQALHPAETFSYPPSRVITMTPGGRPSLLPFELHQNPTYRRDAALGSQIYLPDKYSAYPPNRTSSLDMELSSPALHHQPSQEPVGSPVYKTTEPSKNLIGACHTSLQPLVGLDGKVGLFFVFQDLSVRTEGWFRLKCTLFALGDLGLEGIMPQEDQVHKGLFLEGPCLASCFTKPFKVFSAKKFPGVVETTEWSEHLAKQGIKIPIRKPDKAKNGSGGVGGEYGEGDDDYSPE